MKKVLLGAAALLMTGGLFAQNLSNSNQSGDDQRVYVRQAGTNLSSEIDQANGGGAGSHRAMVLQKGDLNSSDIDQEGTNNQVLVEQGAFFTPPTGASAIVKQGKNNASSADNKARVAQHGGTNSTTTVSQDGDANHSDTHQDATDSSVDVTQDGVANKSYVAQLPYYSAVNNSATINQTDGNNQSWAYQDGDDNTLTATQSGWDNKVDQYQNGNGNTANSTQSGNNGKVKQVQVGDNNINNMVFQTGDSNYSEDNQYGNGNEIFKGQQGFNNSGRIDQTGNDNYTSFGQYGSNSIGYVRQIGNDNTMTMGQFAGDGNLASSYQDDNNTGVIQQTGDANQALLVQKSQGGAGHTAGIWQNGNGNMADVLQLGPDGNWADDAEGCDFQPEIELNCPTPLPPVVINDPCPNC